MPKNFRNHPVLNTKDRREVQAVVENEGFDYAFRFYSDFSDIQDATFHKLRAAYVDAAQELAAYAELD